MNYAGSVPKNHLLLLLILYFKCFLWPLSFTACDEGPGLCAHLITFLSILLVFVTIPFSLCFAVKVVQEYERVVIFRLGRLLSGGARGPGIFFVVPCVDSYQKVDMRTLTFDVPPQEVRHFSLNPQKRLIGKAFLKNSFLIFPDI